MAHEPLALRHTTWSSHKCDGVYEKSCENDNEEVRGGAAGDAAGSVVVKNGDCDDDENHFDVLRIAGSHGGTSEYESDDESKY